MTLDEINMAKIKEEDRLASLEAMRYNICPSCGCPANHPKYPALLLPISVNPPIILHVCTSVIPFKRERCGNMYIPTSLIEELINLKEGGIHKPTTDDVFKSNRSKEKGNIIKP